MSSLSALGGDLKPVERENIHLTMKFLGNVTPAKLAEVKSALAQMEQTEKLLHQVGFSRETRPFSPHITIARARSGRNRDEIASFLGHLAEESFGTFNAEHVRLKQSILSPSGPRYSTLFEIGAQK